jgi:hypothetical protein
LKPFHKPLEEKLQKKLLSGVVPFLCPRFVNRCPGFVVHIYSYYFVMSYFITAYLYCYIIV